MTMRAIYCIFSFILVSSACAEDITLLAGMWGKDNPIRYRVPREELEKVPKWEPTDGKDAPLTRDQAVEIARGAAAAESYQLPDDSKLTVTLKKPNPFEKKLVERLPARGCMWFYKISFGSGGSELEGKDTFVVTMSGAVAKRVP
jgi:hypothetical protein